MEYEDKLSTLPSHMGGAMKRYIEHGIPPGSFLSAVLSNDLKETFARADDENGRAVRDYVVFLYSFAPSGCWGSPDKFTAWQQQGGLHGSSEQEAV